MCALDAIQIAVFEHGTRAVSDVDEDRTQPSSARNSLSPIERCQETLCSGASRLAGIGKHRYRVEFRCPTCDIERGFLVTDSRRAGMPQHPLVQMGQTVDAHAVGLSKGAAILVDCDMDHRAFAPHCRLQAQRRRYRVKDCSPGALLPSGQARVVDVDTVMDACPFVASELAPNVGVVLAGFAYLAS